LLFAGPALLQLTEEKGEWNMREGFMIVALGWLTTAIFSSMPYIFEGIPLLMPFLKPYQE
jgi:trk system potassium uptake protein TrkH